MPNFTNFRGLRSWQNVNVGIASVGEMVNETVIIHNHEIQLATIDLWASTKDNREQLLLVVGASESNIQ